MNLVKLFYEITKDVTQKETYSLTSQITRSAVSVRSNIAERYRRNGRTEYLQFCGIAAGSASELETQLLIAQRVYNVECDSALSLVAEVQKMLYALIRQLKTKP